MPVPRQMKETSRKGNSDKHSAVTNISSMCVLAQQAYLVTENANAMLATVDGLRVISSNAFRDVNVVTIFSGTR